MGLKKEGLHAIGWSVTDKMLKRLVQFVMSIFLARLLSPSDFGVVAMASIFMSWAEVFRDFGLGQAIVQRKEVSEVQYSTVFYFNVAIGIIIALIFVFLAPLASRFYENDAVAWVLRIGGVTFFINSLNVIQSARFNKKLNYKVSTVSSFLSSTLSGIIGIIMAFLGYGIWSLIVQGVVASIVSTVYIWIKSTWRPSLLFSFKDVKPMLGKGAGFMGHGFINSVFSSLDSMVIGKFYNPATLGFFHRGKVLADMPRDTLLLPITRPLFPLFSKIQDDIETVRRQYLRIVHLLNWVMIFIAGWMLVCSSEIILLLYSAKWADTIIYFQLWLLISPLYPGWNISTSIWKALGKTRLLVQVTFVERILLFISLIVGLSISIKAFIILSVISHIIVFFIKTYLDSKLRLPVKKMYQQWVKNILIMAIGFFLCNFIEIPSLIVSFLIKSILFSIIYIVLSKVFALEGKSIFMTEFGAKIFSKIKAYIFI